MNPVVPARDLSRRELEHRFGLQQRYDEAFFPEVQDPAIALQPDDQTILDRAKTDFLYLAIAPRPISSTWPKTRCTKKLSS
ncbi:MAG: hypothetical protein AAGG51_21635 [Cyanobacteria bacterium P01_G01_bin.54]